MKTFVFILWAALAWNEIAFGQNEPAGTLTVEGLPAIVPIDVIKVLQDRFPNIKDRQVILVEVGNNPLPQRFVNRGRKNRERMNTKSISKSVSGTRPGCLEVAVKPGSKILAGDVLIANYNQSLTFLITSPKDEPRLVQVYQSASGRSAPDLRLDALDRSSSHFSEFQRLSESSTEFECRKPKTENKKSLAEKARQMIKENISAPAPSNK